MYTLSCNIPVDFISCDYGPWVEWQLSYGAGAGLAKHPLQGGSSPPRRLGTQKGMGWTQATISLKK